MFNLAIMVKTEGTVAVGSSDLLGIMDYAFSFLFYHVQSEKLTLGHLRE